MSAITKDGVPCPEPSREQSSRLSTGGRLPWRRWWGCCRPPFWLCVVGIEQTRGFRRRGVVMMWGVCAGETVRDGGWLCGGLIAWRTFLFVTRLKDKGSQKIAGRVGVCKDQWRGRIDLDAHSRFPRRPIRRGPIVRLPFHPCQTSSAQVVCAVLRRPLVGFRLLN